MPIFSEKEFVDEEYEAETGEGLKNHNLWISDAGGLTQFGAFVEVLHPGSVTSIKHYHMNEDEMVYVLEGEITVIEGDKETVMKPGEAATFKAGVRVGHYLQNRSQSITRCLVVGTRADKDEVVYPDNNRILQKDRENDIRKWSDFDGNPADSPYR